jgi:hypothetical protein
MATWGKLKIEYEKDCTLYYSYSTTVDGYYLLDESKRDYGMGEEQHAAEYRFDREAGEAIMEALVNHTMAYEGLTEEQFVERYIRNNRFKKAKG